MQQCPLHPIEQAIRLSTEFVKIHPFIDGNGRTSRLLLNLVLMQYGFPVVVLPVEQRLDYYHALENAHIHNNYDGITGLVTALLEKSFNRYWFALGVE